MCFGQYQPLRNTHKIGIHRAVSLYHISRDRSSYLGAIQRVNTVFMLWVTKYKMALLFIVRVRTLCGLSHKSHTCSLLVP